MHRHPICGKMDTQKQLNVPLEPERVIWLCKNYDGDLASAMVAGVYGGGTGTMFSRVLGVPGAAWEPGGER